MSMRLRVSVILTVLNEAGSLEALLEAMFAQSHVPDEVVVVDGGSRDGTMDVLQRVAARHPTLRYASEPGVNIARGRNLAIALATGDVIAVTDGGCRPDSGWLEGLLAPMEQDPSIAATSGQILVETRGVFEDFVGLLYTLRREERVRAQGLFYGRSSAFRKELWERVGGYPEWLYTAEDSLFALRAKQLGFRIAFAPASRLFWRPRPSLRKVAKMFFLYGRGNGRINWGEARGSRYWLRYHLLWIGTLLGGLFYPPLLVVAVLTLAFLYHRIVLPVMREVRRSTNDRRAEWYIPLLVMTRHIATNLGFLYGQYEYHHRPGFRDNLRRYLGGSERPHELQQQVSVLQQAASGQYSQG